MKDSKQIAFENIVENASPYITLTYVVDDDGKLLASFSFHPQMDEIELTLQVTGSEKQALCTAKDIRQFADKLRQFANTAETVQEAYSQAPFFNGK
jgi:hypothetical protein